MPRGRESPCYEEICVGDGDWWLGEGGGAGDLWTASMDGRASELTEVHSLQHNSTRQ